MMISPVQLKQVLESPHGSAGSAEHKRTEPVLECPSCRVRLYVDRKKYGGKKVSCPQCQQQFVVPRSPERDEGEKPGQRRGGSAGR